MMSVLIWFHTGVSILHTPLPAFMKSCAQAR